MPSSPDSSTTLVTPHGSVTIVSRPDDSRPARRRRDEHRDFLASHWPGLAAAAYEGYGRHGAGAVVLWTETRPRRLLRRPFEPERLFYTTQIHAIPGTSDADFDGWEARELETYDPQRQALVVFVESGRVMGYRASGTLAPPVALRRSRAAHN